MTHKQIQILIADRSLLFRSGLRSFISSEPDMTVIGEAGTFSEALAHLSTRSADVVVLDSGLARDTCPSVMREVSCPLLWLAKEETDEELHLAIRSGARGYMLKNSTPAELIAGIRHVSSMSDDEPRGLSKIIPDLQALQNSTKMPDRASDLTVREQEVVRMLAEGRTAREAAAELGLSVKTIEAHKLNLMRKLAVHNRAHLVAYAIRTGLVASELTR
ncbi:MAG: response regulator transcription factor [Acidobacteriaceae bacterium]|nr:response regulator transcription factor [Acidobacteriaceae bacterium]